MRLVWNIPRIGLEFICFFLFWLGFAMILSLFKWCFVRLVCNVGEKREKFRNKQITKQRNRKKQVNKKEGKTENTEAEEERSRQHKKKRRRKERGQNKTKKGNHKTNKNVTEKIYCICTPCNLSDQDLARFEMWNPQLCGHEHMPWDRYRIFCSIPGMFASIHLLRQ